MPSPLQKTHRPSSGSFANDSYITNHVLPPIRGGQVWEPAPTFGHHLALPCGQAWEPAPYVRTSPRPTMRAGMGACPYVGHHPAPPCGQVWEPAPTFGHHIYPTARAAHDIRRGRVPCGDSPSLCVRSVCALCHYRHNGISTGCMRILPACVAAAAVAAATTTVPAVAATTTVAAA